MVGIDLAAGAAVQKKDGVAAVFAAAFDIQ